MKSMNTLRQIIFSLALLLLSFGASAQKLQEGRTALERAQFDLAQNIFSALMTKDPGNAAYNYYMGYLYLQNDMKDSADYFFNKGVKENANEPLNYVGLGRLQLLRGNAPEARINFEKAISLSKGKDAYLLQQVADAYVDAQDVQNADYAAEQINKAIKLDPKNPSYQVTLGDVYRIQGDAGKGMTQYTQVGNTFNYPLAWLRAGELMAKVKNIDQAKNYFSKVDAGFPPLYKDYANLYFNTGQVNKAIESYKKYLDMVGHSPAERLRYAGFLFVNKEYPQSLSELQQVESAMPGNIILLRLMAYAYHEKGDNAKAEEYINKYFSKVKPEDIIAQDYMYYGKILTKNNKPQEAVSWFNKALAKDSSNLDALEWIAQSYAAQKKFDSAAYFTSLKVKGSGEKVNTQDIYYLGVYYYQAANYAMSDTTFAKLIEYMPDYLPSYLFRARANAAQDNKMEKGLAKPYYEAYITKALAQPEKLDTYKDGLVEAYDYLASFSYAKKQYDSAKDNSQKALALNANDKTAQSIIKAINGMKKPAGR
jgi:tetratricopeptide (TPR) repeat protein